MQLKFLLTAIIMLVLFSCGTNSGRQKELDAKEKEFAIKGKELERKQNDSAKYTNNATVDQEQKFEVPLGKTVNGFTYSGKGDLTFNGKSFTPNITALPVNVPQFKISLLQSKKIAGAIAMDIDGQNSLFLLDLSKLTATPLQGPNSWNAAQEVYWSPSTKYMVAFCSYEGQSFLSINTESKKIVEMDNLKPGTSQKTRWMVDNEPKWMDNKDILTFTVAEYCNPYEVDCGETADKVLAKYKVNLDVATLKISKGKEE